MKIPLMKKDKAIELDRYDSRAKSKGDIIKDFGQLLYGSEITPSFLAEPYRVYESIIKANVSRDSRVLELGAGTGEHTKILLDTSNDVVASDISINSLRLMEKKFACYPNLKTCEADIESLPFDNCSFDVVCSAGCLSYGDPDLVNREIFRILRGGGVLICVDSLNHNPIYRFNRWLHYLQGNRTKSTLAWMPTLDRINDTVQAFEFFDIKFYGSLTWLMPLTSAFIGRELSAKFSSWFDKFFNVKKSAFKFVLIATKFK